MALTVPGQGFVRTSSSPKRLSPPDGSSRLVLLAHHPSDVAGGALVGIVGAMAVRYWFAARHLGFDIREGGEIVPL